MKRLLIKNGMVVDGSGNEPYKSDILINNSKIVEISNNLFCSESVDIIDANGYLVAPGLIDPHTHSDLAILSEDRLRASSVYQGVTTEVVGLCGLGFVPLTRDDMIETMQFNAGLFGYKKEYENYDFSSFEKYMTMADKAGVNIAVSATHNAARISASGYNRETNLKKMCSVIRNAMEAGCVGISTGLSYYPCAYADTQELLAICNAIKGYDGLFLAHIRYPKESDPYGALKEFIDLGIMSGARIHILHYRTKYPLDAGRPEVLLDMFRNANDNGADITLETCPYISGSTAIHAILPDWVMEGGLNKILERLQNPELRTRIIDEMQGLIKLTVCGNGNPARFGIVGAHPEFGGKFILDIMKERGQTLEDLLIDMMIDSKLNVNYVGNESGENPNISKLLYEDIMTLLLDPLYLVGSDAMPYGKYVHPRTFGCYSKMLRLSLEYNIPIEKIIRKLTFEPAKRLGLNDRGLLNAGNAADIIVFKREDVRDRANFANPFLTASGMKYVFINGKIIIKDGIHTGIAAGKLLKKEWS